MENIKKSFTKNFLPILIASVIFSVISAVFSVLGGFGSLLDLILTPPLYIGFYSFLFRRMEDEAPEISSVFKFYRSGKSWWKSFCMFSLGGIIVGAALFLLVIFLILCVFAGSITDVGDGIGMIFFMVFLVILGLIFFILMPFLYAKNPHIGIGDALSKSFRYGLKYLWVFLAIYIVIGAIGISLLVFDNGLKSVEDFLAYAQEVSNTQQYNQSGSFFSIFVNFITKAFSMWAHFTAAYIIIEREKIFDRNYDYYSTAGNVVDVFEKGAGTAQNVPYNIGGNYVNTQNTFDGNDGSGEETDK